MADFNRRLGSMIVLTTLIVVPFFSVMDDPKWEWLSNEELPRLFILWTLLSFLCAFWSLFLDINRPKITFGLFIKIIWSMGLLATFFIFLNNLEFVMSLAAEYWGNRAGKITVIIFSITWLYTVYTFFCLPRRSLPSSAFTGVHLGTMNVGTMTLDSTINSLLDHDGDLYVPQKNETARMTMVTVLITAAVLYLGYKGYIPDILEKLYAFLVIWLSWICVFFVGHLMLMTRNISPVNKFLELFKIDFGDIPWTNFWDYIMMTALIAFGITLFRYVLPTPFGLQEYLVFCSFLMIIVIGFIHIFKFLMDDDD